MRVALVAGLALLVLALVIVLAQSPPRVLGSNAVPVLSAVGYLEGGAKGCEQGGTMPSGTSAIRLSFGSNIGPTVAVKAYAGSSLVTEGSRGSGWGIAETVTVPVRRLARTTSGSEVCVSLGPVTEPVEVHGAVLQTRTAGGSTRRVERYRVEYLAGSGSWWSRISEVARRLGLGHSPGGTWVVFLELLLMLAAAVIAVRLVLRATDEFASTGAAPAVAREQAEGHAEAQPAEPERPAGVARQAGTSHAWATLRSWLRAAGRALAAGVRRIPRAAWMCAAVAVLSAACWSLITPPFQSPDEPSHFAYVQHLAETGKLPVPREEDTWSQEEKTALTALHHGEVRFYPERQQIRTEAEQRKLESSLNAPLNREGEGGAGVAHSQPPVYYALQTIPYHLGSGGSILTRIELMRLLSALMAGFTALFGYLFVREALPRRSWAWPIGGLAIAFTPLLGFMSGVVNPESMLIAVATAAFFLLARAFRRGLSLWLALAIGATVVLGFETKVNFIGLAPGIILALVLLGLREAREPLLELWRRLLRRPTNTAPQVKRAGRRGSAKAARTRPPAGRAPQRESVRTTLLAAAYAFRWAALALVIAIAPVIIYLLANAAGGGSAFGSVSQIEHPTAAGSFGGELEYIWQFYLPRLPGMSVDFPGIAPWRDIWFNRSVGLYGWLDTHFPAWLYTFALAPALILAALALRSLFIERRTVRRRLGELVCYALILLGLSLITGAASYVHFPGQAGTYGEPRYFLPLIALLGAAVAMSARGAGRRWGPAVGALIVVLFLAWDIFSQLQTIARFYG